MFQGNLNAGREAAFPGLLMLGAGEGGLAAWSSYQSLCPSGPSPDSRSPGCRMVLPGEGYGERRQAPWDQVLQ